MVSGFSFGFYILVCEPRLCFQAVLCTLGVMDMPGLGRKPELEGRFLMGGFKLE